MYLKDRKEAGVLLGQKLLSYKDQDNVVVLSLPRGGVVLGYEIAQLLHAPHDIVVTRKIGYPHNPEFAVCVTNAEGRLLCDERSLVHIPKEWIAEEKKRQQSEAQRRLDVYRAGRKPLSLSGKVVIVVDDGIATGLSMKLALAQVRQENPRKIVLAVPIMPQEVYEYMEVEADEVVTLIDPRWFQGSVGAHYENFNQVTDKEVLALLDD